MYQILLIGVFLTVVSGAPRSKYDELALAENCNEQLCRLPDCRCSSTAIPAGLSASETPQVGF